ncbi:MAG: low molecular weight phosphotyrosine protein phosphatase [Acidimicrobiia bacterium]
MTDHDRHFRILVLCAGNIGRSPLAGAMLRAGLADSLGVAERDLEIAGVTVVSAGTAAPEGHAASGRGMVLAGERGLDLTGHRAHQLTRSDLKAADLVLCMDNHQIAAVAELLPDAAGKTELIAGDGLEILDPHHQSDAFFRDIAGQIEAAVTARIPGLLEQIHEPTGPAAGSE